MRRLNKRGQFYLIAALVILTIFGGFIAVSNSVSYVKNPHIMDLKNEIRTEASAAINYGTYNAEADAQIESALINVSKYYIDEIPDGNLYFLLGTKDNMTLVAYQSSPEGVFVNGGKLTGIGPKSTYEQSGFTPDAGKIDIKTNETNYNFTINEGENFHFAISSFASGQKYSISD